MRYVLLVLSFIVLMIVSFYFWASQALHCEKTYDKIERFSSDVVSPLPDTFAIMTYNIGYLSGMTNNLPVSRSEDLFTTRLNRSVALFKVLNPDIIVFQEIDFYSSRSYFVNQYRKLGKLGGYAFGAMAVNWDKQYVPFPYWPIHYHFGEIYSGQAVLSKARIYSNRREVLPQPEANPFYYNSFYLERLAQVAWVATTTDSLLLINVHLEAYDAATRELQAKIVLNVFKEYEQKYPIILMGDFNCNPYYDKIAYPEETMKILLDEPYISSVIKKEEYIAKPKSFYTFSSRDPVDKIDFILYNNRFLQCEDARVIHEAEDISDHLPLMAKLVLKPR